ncbi:hypothetical protein [Streptomyces yanii]|uniref:Uncharacterized protein n=1 Tax=Streptomyces yanii TaxID=78510 RepID=A0ABV5R3I0_9ACTN
MNTKKGSMNPWQHCLVLTAASTAVAAGSALLPASAASAISMPHGAVQTPSSPAVQSDRANVDWNNRIYRLTCDDIVSTAVPVTVRNGSGTAGGGAIGGYDRWDVRIQQIAQGTLPRLGNVAAVLFSCSPQPSNFYVEELRIYRTTDGREVGRTPTFQVAGLSPKYQPNTVRFSNGHLLADVKFYGPGDSHASGPSILRHVTWGWNGREFVKQSEVEA